MSEIIRILQLGTEDWRNCYRLPDYVELTFSERFSMQVRRAYDMVFVDRTLAAEEIPFLMKATKPYTLYVTDKEVWSDEIREYYDCKKGKRILSEKIQDFLLQEVRNYFDKPYGEKSDLINLAIAQGFRGSVTWNGKCSMLTEGDYGEEFHQIAYWRNNIPIYEGQAIDFWLEYKKDPQVEIALSITQFKNGAVANVQQTWYFSEEELEDLITVENSVANGSLFVSILAKGSGKLNIISLSNRYSRRGHGVFLPGGNRYVTSEREEIFYYFDPGDRKPPFNVYFSRYKTLQGFEGYQMMKRMGCPFLLLSEPRLDGGCFYLGSEEYEKAVAEIIFRHMEELQFSGEQVILSGISMGAFAALYYGCDILPHAMIVGKPLVNLGDIAENERLHRPGGFPTSLDVLQYLTGATDSTSVKQLNDRFWKKFDTAKWEKAKFVLAYMIEDDYDDKAYNMLLTHVKSEDVKVYGKGIHGRHDDESKAINEWFKSQYEKILSEDFSRKAEQ